MHIIVLLVVLAITSLFLFFLDRKKVFFPWFFPWWRRNIRWTVLGFIAVWTFFCIDDFWWLDALELGGFIVIGIIVWVDHLRST